MKFLSVKKTEFCTEIKFCFGVKWKIWKRRRMLMRTMEMTRFLLDAYKLQQRGVSVAGDASWAWTGRYDIRKMRVGELKRIPVDTGTPIPLPETDLVRYFATGDERHELKIHEAFARCGKKLDSGHKQRSDDLAAELAGNPYDPSRSSIVVFENGELVDGNHRASYICAKEGPDAEVVVVRILPPVWRDAL